MKRLLPLIICVLFVWPIAGHAEGTSIGVVDVIYIMNNADASKHIQEQRNVLREQFLEEISETEQKLRDQEKALIEQRQKLNKEEYAKKRKEYEENLLKTRRYAQNKKQALEGAANEGMNVLRAKLYEVVQQIAVEREYDLVISNKNVIAGANALDITEEALKRINASLTEVPLKATEEH